jgi:hypothetical protein
MEQYGMMYQLIFESTDVLVSDTSMVQYGMIYQWIVESINVYVDVFTPVSVLVTYQLPIIVRIKIGNN